MTVRRDLEILHEHGLLEKVHGGATASRASPFRAGIRRQVVAPAGTRRRRSPPRPRTSSSPAWRSRSPRGRRPTRSPRASREIPGVTVVTNSIRVADVLYRIGRRDQTVILTGGVADAVGGAGGPVRGRRSCARCTSTSCSWASTAWTRKAGFTCPNLSEAETDRALDRGGAPPRRARGPHASGAWSGSRRSPASTRPTSSSPDTGLDAGARSAARDDGARAHPRPPGRSHRRRAWSAVPRPTTPRAAGDGPSAVPTDDRHAARRRGRRRPRAGAPPALQRR